MCFVMFPGLAQASNITVAIPLCGALLGRCDAFGPLGGTRALWLKYDMPEVRQALLLKSEGDDVYFLIST